MFKVNDYIVYGTNGVCKILDIGRPNINMADKTKQYYKLQPIYENRSIIYTPVDNNKVLIRKIITKEEANELMNNINLIKISSFNDDNMCEEKYKEIIHECNCKKLIRIIKILYSRKKIRLAEGKKNSAIDNRYLKMAEECLFGEMSISLNISKEQVKEFMIQRLDL